MDVEWRLKVYKVWLKMEEPSWQTCRLSKINFQDIIYYAAQTQKEIDRFG
ncbi:MAG: hypothetical protein IPJ22_01780 [Bacteroidetes bacterium]|nr:hypothetical protein [Bacteroidota bacterium]